MSRGSLHIGLIMDGNGRWAEKRHLPRTAGHLEGIKALKKVITAADEIPEIGYVTLYCFSTENWRRPADEVNYLMAIFAEKTAGELPFLISKNIRVLTVGDLSPLPEDAKASLAKIKEETKDNDGLVCILALNYGGQSEICQAANRAIADGVKALDPDLLRSYFEHPEVPPADLIARSAGEKRLSNFLLFDSAYSELIFCDTLWPDWDGSTLKDILAEYHSRTRRFGGVLS